MAREGTGFGHFRFGNHPFGKSNYGEDVISRNMEEVVVDDRGRRNERLAHYLELIEDSVNRSKLAIDQVPDQVDVDRVDANLLPFLGTTFDVVIDDSEPEEFQRSLVSNAIQFYRIKGTLASYQIRGKISGFDVSVDNLFKINSELVPFFETDDLYEFPPLSGNFFTVLPPGSVSGDERLDELSCDYCLTTAIKLNFEIVKVLPPAITGEGNFFDRLAFKLRDIIPIHVRDLLFEIRSTICVFANDQVVCVSGEEVSFTPVAVAQYYDHIPADVVPLDNHSYAVSGIATEV